jgi:hypothetical protein
LKLAVMSKKSCKLLRVSTWQPMPWLFCRNSLSCLTGVNIPQPGIQPCLFADPYNWKRTSRKARSGACSVLRERQNSACAVTFVPPLLCCIETQIPVQQRSITNRHIRHSDAVFGFARAQFRP